MSWIEFREIRIIQNRSKDRLLNGYLKLRELKWSKTIKEYQRSLNHSLDYYIRRSLIIIYQWQPLMMIMMIWIKESCYSSLSLWISLRLKTTFKKRRVQIIAVTGTLQLEIITMMRLLSKWLMMKTRNIRMMKMLFAWTLSEDPL